MKKFYLGIDTTTIDLNHNQFLVHLEHGDLLVIPTTIEEVTQILVSSMHVAPLSLSDYMSLMGMRCTKLGRGFKASTTF